MLRRRLVQESCFSDQTQFDEAEFFHGTKFARASFSKESSFVEAVFSGESRFEEAIFSGKVGFNSTVFSGDTNFSKAQFDGGTSFRKAIFSETAKFNRAIFTQDVGFEEVTFSSDVSILDGTFSGEARFNEAEFSGEARLNETSFLRGVSFDGVNFIGDAYFRGVEFSGAFREGGGFNQAIFSRNAWFNKAKFLVAAWFNRTKFSGVGDFGEAEFGGDARFDKAEFTHDARFDNAIFTRDARFDGAKFETGSQLGPIVCRETLNLSGAVFNSPVTIEASTARLTCQRTRWAATALLRLRYASVDLSGAVVEYPLSLVCSTSRLVGPRTTGPVDETVFGLMEPTVKILSLSGMDASHLVVTDIDLANCRFIGTVHLDQLHMEGRSTFAGTPAGIHRHRWRFFRWTPRRTLAEEHHWRAVRSASGWTAAPAGIDPPGPTAISPVYRQLRKSLEDNKNEPDAADFYYGEMEMRRYDGVRPFSERALLAAYWALSGYGLRASRALGWLFLAMTGTVLVMMLWGLPKDDPKPAIDGRLTGHIITLTTNTPDPVNPGGPLRERLTTDRWEKSIRVVVNSVIFRSSGQDLTTAGTYTEMLSRLSEPVLLGLAALAVRGRVKR
ncbi:pentapeptide repeat-containing protein [Streptomyces sp. DSM 40484]|uniref:pentapeptide repeat-containing protein n=1 Tax=Streptomyces kroppenstedtii TaxID=3051181 RepID=UPI0028D68BEE|nr:pentapeptide repeat-containing protein [Streptomyces sp. DSM 40484]